MNTVEDAKSGEEKTSWWRVIWRGMQIALIVLVLLFLAMIIRDVSETPALTAKEVQARIQAAHIMMSDVDGTNLPPRPSAARAAASVEGVDANHNGIRDDIELAIYDALPIVATTSETGYAEHGDANFRLRAAQLQFAKETQLAYSIIVDKDSWYRWKDLMATGELCMARAAIWADMPKDKAIELTAQWEQDILERIIDTPDRSARLEQVAQFADPDYHAPVGRCDID